MVFLVEITFMFLLTLRIIIIFITLASDVHLVG
jgi:hypothetical protein